MYNTLCLLAIDIALGILVGSLLLLYSQEVIAFVHSANDFLTNRILRSQIRWLMGWPAGFKLNDELDHSIGTIFLFYLDRWTG